MYVSQQIHGRESQSVRGKKISADIQKDRYNIGLFEYRYYELIINDVDQYVRKRNFYLFLTYINLKWPF